MEKLKGVIKRYIGYTLPLSIFLAGLMTIDYKIDPVVLLAALWAVLALCIHLLVTALYQPLKRA